MKTLGDKVKENMGIDFGKPIEREEEINQSTKDYWKNVMESKKIEYPLPKAEVLLEYFSHYAQEILNVTNRKFSMDENNRWVIEGLCVYFSQDSRFSHINTINENSLGKGLLLIGECGTGKTLISKTIHKMFLKVPKRAFGYVNSNNVVKEYDKKGEDGILKYMTGEWYFDDFGSEDKGKFYGKEQEIFKSILEARYDLFIDKGIKTYLSTNLDPAAMKKRYGDRVYSRINEMFNIIIIGGEDRRK